jgi:hypothetical protein
MVLGKIKDHNLRVKQCRAEQSHEKFKSTEHNGDRQTILPNVKISAQGGSILCTLRQCMYMEAVYVH